MCDYRKKEGIGRRIGLRIKELEEWFIVFRVLLLQFMPPN